MLRPSYLSKESTSRLGGLRAISTALVLSETDKFSDAIIEMKRYLALVPDAPDARALQDKIYDWLPILGSHCRLPGADSGSLYDHYMP